MDNFLSASDASVIDNLMPGNQLLRVGAKLKYALDRLGIRYDSAGNVVDVAYATDATHAINFAGCAVGSNTDGTLISTGSTWLIFPTAGQTAVKLLCASSASSGDFATLRTRARADGAGNVKSVNASASANVDNYGDMCAVEGYAQPNAKNQAGASNIICGVYSCVDRSGTSAGRSWSLWTDTHETNTASASHYLHRLSNNGVGLTLNGIWTIYAGAGSTYLFNFENANAPVGLGDVTGGTKSHKLAVLINGTPGFIQVYT